MAVVFEEGLTAERKTALVVAAGGVELVGGGPLGLHGVDGIYLVRLEGYRTAESLDRTIAALDAMPGVASAFLLASRGQEDR